MTHREDPVAAVRAFNRFYTRLIGLLEEGLVQSPWTLTEARVLFEIARRGASAVPDLRAELGLDAGYLSRILGRFESEGLLLRERSPEDARRQVVQLTDAGREAFGRLDEGAAAQIEALLAPLGEDQRRELVAAMERIQGLLSRSRPAAPTLRSARPGDLGWVVARHGALYAREYGWDQRFEALVARIVADFAASYDPAREALWIAELQGEPAGCIFCARRSETVAQLRCLLVEPWARGAGVGSRLVDQCLRFAEDAGYEEIVLWTHDVLTDARRLYERAGFTLVEQGPHRAYGHDLVEQTWSKRLR